MSGLGLAPPLARPSTQALQGWQTSGAGYYVGERCRAGVKISRRHFVGLFTSSGGDDNSGSQDEIGSEQNQSGSPEEEGVMDRINSFLDTPILDANDRSDQGPLVDKLKAFVRRDPQVASVTFSVVALLVFVLIARLYNLLTYGF